MKNKFVFALAMGLFSTLFAMAPTLSFANGITIGAGATLALGDASLDLNCMDITITSGATLNMENGRISHCGRLYTESGGIFTQASGIIYFCSGSLPAVMIPLLLH